MIHTPALPSGRSGRFLHNETPAIMAGFNKGFADEQKTNKNSAKNVFVSKAPSGRELSPKVTEGECDTLKFYLILKLRRLLPPQAVPLPLGGRLGLSPA